MTTVKKIGKKYEKMVDAFIAHGQFLRVAKDGLSAEEFAKMVRETKPADNLFLTPDLADLLINLASAKPANQMAIVSRIIDLLYSQAVPQGRLS